LMVTAGIGATPTSFAMLGSCEVKMIGFGASESAVIGVGETAGLAGGLSANAAVVTKAAARTKAVMVFAFMRVG